MSTIAEPIQEIIVQGYKDRPARLNAVAFRGRSVEAVGTDPATPMPFHASRVFRFEADLYQRLLDAFSAGDTKMLALLWRQAKPIR